MVDLALARQPHALLWQRRAWKRRRHVEVERGVRRPRMRRVKCLQAWLHRRHRHGEAVGRRLCMHFARTRARLLRGVCSCSGTARAAACWPRGLGGAVWRGDHLGGQDQVQVLQLRVDLQEASAMYMGAAAAAALLVRSDVC